MSFFSSSSSSGGASYSAGSGTKRTYQPRPFRLPGFAFGSASGSASASGGPQSGSVIGSGSASTSAVPVPVTTTRKRARGESGTGMVIEYFIAIFLPPLAVFLVDGCSSAFIINIALTVLGWIPGAVHALWCVAKKDPASKIQPTN